MSTLAETAACAPLSVYILYGYIRGLPEDLGESGRLNGASIWQILAQIVLPVVAPGMAATAMVVNLKQSTCRH